MNNRQPSLFPRLKTLMFLRVIFASILLGASIIIQIEETRVYFGHIQALHFLLIASIYLLTCIYAFLLKYSRDLTWVSYLQLILDTLLVTAIIYTTGGAGSVFSFLYFLTIISGSIILYRKGGMIVASSCTILYGLLLILHHYGLIHPLGLREYLAGGYQSPSLFYLILVNTCGFYLVAYLSSYLSEQTKKSRVELDAKTLDIHKLEALNESIINNMHSALIALDDENRVILANPASEKLFGVKFSDAFGRKVEEAYPRLLTCLRDQNLQLPQFLEEETPLTEITYIRPQGERLFLRFSTSTLELPTGNRHGHLVVFQDVTKLRGFEEEMRKIEDLALVGELAASITHEIRNPMASISGSIEMLRESLPGDDVSNRLMEIILREISRLNSLVNDFLLFARPKKTVLESFSLHQMLVESLELFQNSQYWNQKIRIRTDFRRAPWIRSDPQQIKQVLWNLFLNAIEAMPEGGSLNISADVAKTSDTSSQDSDRARIVVRDTGKGFDKASLSKIFTPFFTTKDKGSGLGLAIVKRIIEGLCGEIHARNHPQGGAEITLLLPISYSDGQSEKTLKESTGLA